MKQQSTEGIIIKSKKCWWLKINTKPVRSHSLDGAVFPYLLTVRYSANGTELVGKKLVLWKEEIPRDGGAVTVRYAENKPRKILGVLPESKKRV